MFVLKLTGVACPEQYDVFMAVDHGNHKAGDLVGYFRLRHGCFTADYPDLRGREVYTAAPMGDGCFEDDERAYHLNAACRALRDAVEGKEPDRDPGELLYVIEGQTAEEALAALRE